MSGREREREGEKRVCKRKRGRDINMHVFVCVRERKMCEKRENVCAYVRVRL